MEICERSFEIVKDHLETLDYNGPLALSCDDTKLFATLSTRDCFLLGFAGFNVGWAIPVVRGER